MLAPEPKRKKWYRSAKGKKQLLRAMVHRRKAQLERLELLRTLDFDPTPNTSRKGSYLEFLRTRDRTTLARMTLFLLQVVIRICTHWRPSPDIAEVYGEGFKTAPRLALLFLMER